MTPSCFTTMQRGEVALRCARSTMLERPSVTHTSTQPHAAGHTDCRETEPVQGPATPGPQSAELANEAELALAGSVRGQRRPPRRLFERGPTFRLLALMAAHAAIWGAAASVSHNPVTEPGPDEHCPLSREGGGWHRSDHRRRQRSVPQVPATFGGGGGARKQQARAASQFFPNLGHSIACVLWRTARMSPAHRRAIARLRTPECTAVCS